MHRGFSPPTNSYHNYFGTAAINSTQAKTLVENDIPTFKIGTTASIGTNWIVPVEDDNGVVATIRVAKVSASTAEQASSIVAESMNGWTAGEPQLTRTAYLVPVLDSTNTVVSQVGVDLRSGEIITRPSTILAVSTDEAKSIVADAVASFNVSNVKEHGSVWIVSITFNEVVMNVVLGKLNTPTSDAALQAVQDSLAAGWSAGEPTQMRFIYSVPITDSNGNTLGNILVDAKTGNIGGGSPTDITEPSNVITAFPPVRGQV
jgi:hypothetical protein